MKLHFFGGAKVVTGANYLIEFGQTKILVDCGLFQGPPELAELNYADFPYDPKTISYVFITHSHLDHCGRLAKLVKKGFNGQIICTPPTRDLMAVALADAVHLLKDEARQKNQEPLYEQQDLDKTLKLIKTFEYGQKIKLSADLEFNFKDAGHILGSSIIELWVKENGKTSARGGSASGGKKIVFTGDLGNPPTPLLKPTEYVRQADYVIIESAYGDRIHESKKDRQNILRNIIMEVIKRRGVLMIPSFAMERTQELLYELNDLVEHKKIPFLPIFIDSPLAIKITQIYKNYEKYFNKKTRYVINSGDDIFNFPGLKFTITSQESRNIYRTPAPKIIIAGSGMSTGGRILFHEKDYLSNPNNCFLVIGFQVEGTLGRKILEGAPVVNILGQLVKNKAQIKAIGSYSAHADQKQLLNFIKKISSPPKKVFIVQGEKEPAAALKKIIVEKLKISAEVPGYEQTFDL